MRLLRPFLVTVAVVAAFILGSNTASADEDKDKTEPNNNGKLADFNFVEFGDLAAPIVVLLTDIDPDVAAKALADIKLHFVSPLGQFLTEGGNRYVDPTAGDRTKAEIDASIGLSAFAAAAMLKWTPQQRVVVAGLGQESGTMAAIVGLAGTIGVRQAISSGLQLKTAQVPTEPLGQSLLRGLTWPPDAVETKAAVALAILRGFQVELAEYDGEGAPSQAILNAYLVEQLVKVAQGGPP